MGQKSSISTRRRTSVRREGESGDRKGNIMGGRKPQAFNLKKWETKMLWRAPVWGKEGAFPFRLCLIPPCASKCFGEPRAKRASGGGRMGQKSSISTRRRTSVRREGESGDRKGNIMGGRKPQAFNLKKWETKMLWRAPVWGKEGAFPFRLCLIPPPHRTRRCREGYDNTPHSQARSRSRNGREW